MNLPASWPVARYRFDFTIETPLHLPAYAGSALRGAFGHALKHIVCVTRQPDCKTCALYRDCAYPAIFAPPPPAHHSVQKFSEIPAPYIIEPPAWGARDYLPGDTLTFNLVLIGQAIKHLPIIAHAWQRAFQQGVGKGNGTASLDRIHWQHESIYKRQEGVLRPHTAILSVAEERPRNDTSVTLQFTTPLRLQHNGKPLGAGEVTPARLLIGLVKRTALLAEFHCGTPLALDFRQLARQAETITGEKQLQWRDWGRYSNRQKQEMKLGGLMGKWTLAAGEFSPFLPFLHLGQWLHVGKETTFGLGGYILQQPN